MKIEQIQEAAQYILSKIRVRPTIAVVLGSGLGSFAEEMTDTVEVPFSEIPGFPVSTVEGHKGCFVFGKLNEKYVLVMRGRVHFYEGYTMQQLAMPVAVMKLMGVQTLLLTNAGGAINEEYEPGDLVVLVDHIKLSLDSPLRGANLEELGGPRFPDMTQIYDKELIELAKEISYGVDIPIHEGVYAFMGGPQYETPAEIRMLSLMGADVVGMSTVPEVIMAAECGMRVLALSFVTNYAAGIEEDKPIMHENVIEAGNLLKDKLAWLLKGIIDRIRTE